MEKDKDRLQQAKQRTSNEALKKSIDQKTKDLKGTKPVHK